MCVRMEEWVADKCPTTVKLTQESLQDHWGRENPETLPKMAHTYAHMHAHSECSLPGKQQSTRWKNMVTMH